MSLSDLLASIPGPIGHALSVGAGVIGTVGTWYGAQKMRKQERTDKRDSDVVDFMRAELEQERSEKQSLRKRITDLEAEIKRLGEELAGFTAIFSVGLNVSPGQITAERIRALVVNSASNMTLLRAIIRQLPVIMFVKEEIAPLREGEPARIVMQALTDIYAMEYIGKNAETYYGREDYEIWGREVADRYREGDRAAREAGKPIRVSERADSLFTDTRGTFIGIKFVVSVLSRTFHIGIGYHQNDDGSTIGLEYVDMDALFKIAGLVQ